MAQENRQEELIRLLEDRILVLDGAMGTMIQAHKLTEEDFRGPRFADHGSSLQGNNDLLSLTQPEIIQSIHRAYLEAGADIIETNSFNSTSVALGDYQLEDLAFELNFASAELACKARDEYTASRKQPATLRGRGHRADQPNGLAVSQCGGPRTPQHHLRRIGPGLQDGGPRSYRGWSGHSSGGDHLRYAKR